MRLFRWKIGSGVIWSDQIGHSDSDELISCYQFFYSASTRVTVSLPKKQYFLKHSFAYDLILSRKIQ